MSIYWIVQWGLAISEIYLCYCFVSILENKGLVENNKKYIWICSILIGSALAINRYMCSGLISYYMILFQCLIIFLSLLPKSKKHRGIKLLVVIVYSVYIACIQLDFCFCFMTFISELNVQKTYIQDTICTVVCYGIAIIWMKILYQCILRLQRKNLYELFLFRQSVLFYGIIGSGIMFFSQCQIMEYGNVRSGRYFLFLFMFVIATAIALVTSIKTINIDDEMKLIELKTNLLEENYQELRNIYRNYAYTGHDMKNHLLILENYCKRGENEKAVQYIEKIQKPIHSIKQYIKSNNEIIDMILNYKFSEAEKKGICIDVEWDLEIVLDIDEVDLCAIFSNLLDNAVKACEVGKDEDRKWIYMSLRNMGDMIFLDVENSIFKGKRGEEENTKELHGYGLKSVKDKVEKYNGMIEWGEKENRFSVVVTFLSTKRKERK